MILYLLIFFLFYKNLIFFLFEFIYCNSILINTLTQNKKINKIIIIIHFIFFYFYFKFKKY
jgi:hypothetical protein